MAKSDLRIVFLDRDGCINERRHDEEDPAKNYVLTWDDFEWIPGAAEAIAKLLDNDYSVIVISNQSGIGERVADYFEVDYIFQRMCQGIRSRARRPHVRLWYSFCPHAEEDDCVCRKPTPGLIISNLVDLNARTANAWMIGDQPTDMMAGWYAGIRKLIKLPSYEQPGSPEYRYAQAAEYVPATEPGGAVIGSLPNAVDFLLRWDHANAEDAE